MAGEAGDPCASDCDIKSDNSPVTVINIASNHLTNNRPERQ